MSNGCHWGQYRVKLAGELRRDVVTKVSEEVLRGNEFEERGAEEF